MNMAQEPSWTKSISNETICTYFYVMFFLIAALAGLGVLVDLMVLVQKPKIGGMMLLRSLPGFAIAILQALFLYIICARSLLK